jgi:hypothetical protein
MNEIENVEYFSEFRKKYVGVLLSLDFDKSEKQRRGRMDGLIKLNPYRQII